MTSERVEPGTLPGAPARPRVLSVDDCPDVRALLRVVLPDAVLSFADCLDSAREHAPFDRFDLVLLDLELPDGSGLDFCREILGGGPSPPAVILVTASDETAAKVEGFEIGVADYLVKPWEPAELRARVAARLRHRAASLAGLRIGAVDICGVQHCAWRVSDDGTRERLPLTDKELRLLIALARRPGEVVSREALLADAWPDAVVGPRTIDTHIGNLRRKLDREGNLIQSVRGVGYRCSLSSPERRPTSSA